MHQSVQKCIKCCAPFFPKKLKITGKIVFGRYPKPKFAELTKEFVSCGANQRTTTHTMHRY